MDVFKVPYSPRIHHFEAGATLDPNRSALPKDRCLTGRKSGHCRTCALLVYGGGSDRHIRILRLVLMVHWIPSTNVIAYVGREGNRCDSTIW